jgi:hypothetical protein
MDVQSTAGADSGSDANILAMPPRQPRPTNYMLFHYEDEKGHDWSDLSRTWRPKDAMQCGLCPAGCSATVGDDGASALCHKKVNRFVSHEEAPLYRSPDTRQVLPIEDVRDIRSGHVRTERRAAP